MLFYCYGMHIWGIFVKVKLSFQLHQKQVVLVRKIYRSRIPVCVCVCVRACVCVCVFVYLHSHRNWLVLLRGIGMEEKQSIELQCCVKERNLMDCGTEVEGWLLSHPNLRDSFIKNHL